MSTTAGPLSGLVVADFSRVLAGPYATMLLADLGAEVVKVERPGTGDDTRAWGPPWSATGPDGAHESTYFLAVNRNKSSIALDLRQPLDLVKAKELIARADVVIENFTPGTLDRLGLGYEQVRRDSPGLVYCSITGFGSGEGAALPGYDLIAQAAGGLMSITGSEADSPTKVGVALVDVVTGLHAAVGILAALRHRDSTGEGQRIEVNLLSSLLSALVNQASAVVAGGVVPVIMGNEHPSIAPYETFPTADRDVVIAIGNDRQFVQLCQTLGIAQVAVDPRFSSNPSRVDHRADLRVIIIERLAEHGADYWFSTLMAAGVPCGPINTIDAAIDLAESLGLEPIATVDGVATIAHPITFERTPATYRLRPPRLPEPGH